MRYLIDSDILSDLYEVTSPDHQKVAGRVTFLQDQDALAVSVLALYELEYGYANSLDEKKPVLRRRIESIRSRFVVHGLSAEAAGIFGGLKKALVDSRSLTKKGSRYHNIDLILAATAVAESCTLVSADSLFGDLQKLEPRLVVQNWREPYVVP
jgi:predicted nucleic acid-binding protein